MKLDRVVSVKAKLENVFVCRNPLRKIPEALLKKRKQRSEAKIKAQKAADVNKRVCR